MCWRYCGHWDDWLINSDKENIKMIVVIIVINSLILKYSCHNANQILDSIICTFNFYNRWRTFSARYKLFSTHRKIVFRIFTGNLVLCCGGSTPLLNYFCLQQFGILCLLWKSKAIRFRTFLGVGVVQIDEFSFNKCLFRMNERCVLTIFRWKLNKNKLWWRAILIIIFHDN